MKQTNKIKLKRKTEKKNEWKERVRLNTSNEKLYKLILTIPLNQIYHKSIKMWLAMLN